jgi:hypothetical protein
MSTYVERLMSEIVEDESGCWNLPNRKKNERGYVWVKIGSTGNCRRLSAHRLVYEHLVGPVPDGLVLDHLCRNRGCCRPSHCEPVTPRENVMRGEGLAVINAAKTHCKHGHEFTAANTYINKRGNRNCRACQARAQREFYARKMGAPV